MLFLVSGLCFFCLIYQTTGMWVAISLICLITAFFLSVYIKSIYSKFRQSPLFSKIISILLASGISYISARRFISNWLPSEKTERLASRIHLSGTMLLSVSASALALLSMAFLTLVFCLILNDLYRIIVDTIPFKEPKSAFVNIKSNLLLMISSVAFMGMNCKPDMKSILSLLLSCLVIVLIFSQINSIGYRINGISFPIKLYSLLSATGVCIFYSLFYIKNSDKVISKIPGSITVFLSRAGIDADSMIWIVFIVLALISSIAIYVFFSLILNYVAKTTKPIFQNLSRIELYICLFTVAALIVFSCFAFTHSNAFWGTKPNHDIIYTSDSSSLVTSNAYLRLYHPENDLRQPLFAVFAAPFVGFGYILSLPLSFINPVFTPLFMNAIQLLMLIAANVMLSKIINLDTAGRVCFMLFTAVTYTTLLFSVMMEQYIVAYFWLIFVIYSYIEHKRATVISLSCAGGTLLTSMVLAPAGYERGQHNSTGRFRSFVTAIEKSVLGFLVVLFAFGRLDVLLNFSQKTTQLLDYAGGENMIGRSKQYLSFVSSCIISPNAIVDKTTYHHISWQLSKSVITQLNIFGIIMIVLCFAGFIVNRKNTITIISALWVCFSVILLCIAGWGSPENGMILYSLYFGWAYIVLLFQLIHWCSKKLRFKYLTPIISSIAIITIAIINYQGIRDLLSFALTYYPI